MIENHKKLPPTLATADAATDAADAAADAAASSCCRIVRALVGAN